MKIILLITFVISTSVVFSQITNNTSFVEGSFNSSSIKLEANSSTGSFSGNEKSFNVFLGMGFTTNEKTALGMFIGRSETKDSSVDFKLTRVGGIYQKFYKMSDGFYFAPRMELSFGFGSSSFSDTYGNENDFDNREIFVGFVPSLQYFLNEKWAINALIGSISYTRRKESNRSSDTEYITKNTNIALDVNSFRVGFQYFLRKKEQ